MAAFYGLKAFEIQLKKCQEKLTEKNIRFQYSNFKLDFPQEMGKSVVNLLNIHEMSVNDAKEIKEVIEGLKLLKFEQSRTGNSEFMDIMKESFISTMDACRD